MANDNKCKFSSIIVDGVAQVGGAGMREMWSSVSMMMTKGLRLS